MFKNYRFNKFLYKISFYILRMSVYTVVVK